MADSHDGCGRRADESSARQPTNRDGLGKKLHKSDPKHRTRREAQADGLYED
eukprot:CAMPEP_0184401524 /NCGR_PEP_ID=MMETSP0007-20130409/79316_1 /TAXON_ID=97485 /ORGANISM="Prymnesium parvum, Strain Texoma1" /LENGTH=51 /DNA_ID=CAMNT_0026756951 /DNA_START=236 /DNA_END=388 /DNA_ORIENTATION=+